MKKEHIPTNHFCKLYEAPRGSVIRVLGENPRIPVASPEISKYQYLLFDHVDGMYSLCYNMNGQIIHLAAFEEVEVVTDFEIIRKLVKRGGRGINGDQPLTWVPICEMSDSWVAAVITYIKAQGRDDSNFSNYMRQELEYRKKNNISIIDKTKS